MGIGSPIFANDSNSIAVMFFDKPVERKELPHKRQLGHGACERFCASGSFCVSDSLREPLEQGIVTFLGRCSRGR